jgi:hypothetical protein
MRAVTGIILEVSIDTRQGWFALGLFEFPLPELCSVVACASGVVVGARSLFLPVVFVVRPGWHWRGRIPFHADALA